MKATLVTIGDLYPTENESYVKYATKVLPLLEGVGGKVLGRFKFQQALVGEDFPDIVFAMEFESADSIKKILQSDEYVALIPFRNKAFKNIKTFICDTL